MKNVQKTLEYLQYVLLSVVILFAIVLRFSTFFGIEPFNVLSNSMKPYFQEGDLVYVDKNTDVVQLQKKDVIAYETEGATVTHRIVNVKSNGFITKGDANETEDFNVVKRENVIGKVVFVIPKLGKVQSYFSRYIVEILGIMLIIVLTNQFLEKKIYEEGEKNYEKRNN